MGLKDYTEEELKKIVQECYCYNDVLRKLGYSTTSGRNHWTIRKRILELGISTEHFTFKKGKQRTDEELFVENSDAKNKVVRTRYKKGNYAPYICDICGQNPEWNGKPLTLVLDHKNGDNTDNRLDNLRWVCPNCNSQLNSTGFHGIKKYDPYGNKLETNVKIIPKKNYCVVCGTEISPKATRCTNCYIRESIKPTEDLPITREDLKKKIRTTPFIHIAEEFGVTDNAIRKWCIKFNLPFKSSVIKSIIDEEWERI